MSFKTTLKNTIKLLWLDRQAIRDLSEDKLAIILGPAFIVLTALGAKQMDIMWGRVSTTLLIAGWLLFSVIAAAYVALISRALGGKGRLVGQYRAYSLTYITFISVLLIFVGIQLIWAYIAISQQFAWWVGAIKAFVIFPFLLLPFLTAWKFIQTILVTAEVQEVRKLTAAAIV
ncbi:MAG: hypothetical protein V1743_06685, partial [Nanoarchaeota archaeon]